MALTLGTFSGAFAQPAGDASADVEGPVEASEALDEAVTEPVKESAEELTSGDDAEPSEEDVIPESTDGDPAESVFIAQANSDPAVSKTTELFDGDFRDDAF